ncbi:hypothetical protein V5H41_29780, partial [Salmonella enterica]
GHGLRGWRSWRGDGSGGEIMTTTSAFMLNVRLVLAWSRPARLAVLARRWFWRRNNDYHISFYA